MLLTFEKLPSEKQNSILEAAASVFAEEGFHYARISKICEKASISNGALYKYFTGKETLFVAVIEYAADLVKKHLYQKFFSGERHLFDSLAHLLEEMVLFNNGNNNYISIYSDLGSSSMNRFARIASSKFKNATSQYTIRMVESAISKGEIRADMSSDKAACLIDSYITLFSFTLVSEYHSNRFDSFFTGSDNSLTEQQRIRLVIDSLKEALTKSSSCGERLIAFRDTNSCEEAI